MTVEATINHLLETIKDPFLDLSAREMNIQHVIEFSSNTLELHLTAGFPTQHLHQHYLPLLVTSLKELFPTHKISVDLNSFIRAHRTQLVGKGLRGIKNTIAIGSGKGGVGKSTVTVNLATALARLGARVGILDADIYGPSIPLMLGQVAPVEVDEDHYLPVEAHGIQAMSIGYLTDNDQALIWRGPMLAKALIQMIDATRWNDLDYLFIDLPPGTGDIQLTLVQKIPLTAAIVVTTPQQVATLDAQKALQMFAKTGIDVLGVVENMSTHICSQCGHEDSIFGAGGAEGLCKTNNTPLLGQLPLNSQIREDSDKGTPSTMQSQQIAETFIKTALNAAVQLANKPINYADKFPNIVVE